MEKRGDPESWRSCNEDGKKIRLDTKVSKTAFIKLLNDDFLRSELTELYYASVAKDNVLKVE